MIELTDVKPKRKRGNPNFVKGKSPKIGWQKGQSGNPAGRPKLPEIQELRDALQATKELKGGQSLLQSICARAYDDSSLAIAIMRKLLPDMTKAEIEETKELIINIVDYSKADK